MYVFSILMRVFDTQQSNVPELYSLREFHMNYFTLWLLGLLINILGPHKTIRLSVYLLRPLSMFLLFSLSSDLSQHVVSDCKQAMDLLEEGIANRITAATHNHDASSRSHAIFSIQYTQVISLSPPIS